MKTLIYSTLTLFLLSACGGTSTEEKKSETVLDDKISIIAEAKKVVQETNKTTQTKETLIKEMNKPINGANIYLAKCASCHGKSAETAAFNASAIIARWPSEKTQAALRGYKDGTYGGNMKAVMQGQTKPLTEEDIKKIADYISTI